jgi:hypothetical protein
MIDRAVLRELAAMLFERAEDPNRVPSDQNSMLAPEEAGQTSAKPARSWYVALMAKRNRF